MPDLGTQLRDYLDETAPPVEFEEVVALIEGRSPDLVPVVVTPVPRRRAWLVAVAAFALVMASFRGSSPRRHANWLTSANPAYTSA